MGLLPLSLLCFVLALFITMTLTVRTGQTGNNTHPSLAIIQVSKAIHCVFLPRSISPSACAGAILRLPIDHTAGIFHTDGADDIFRLPVSQDYNACNVLVEIRGGGFDQDMGNWLDVGRAAAKMNGQCANSIGPYGGYGSAWMNTGDFDRIRITLRPVQFLRDVEWNSTLADKIW